MSKWREVFVASVRLALLAACGACDALVPGAKFAAVDAARISTASAAEEWLTYGGTYDEQRHSRLTAINKQNVAQLGVA